MKYRSIGKGLKEVSLLSLGSWNTFSRISFEDNIALAKRALDLGINLFDVGYYWDKPYTEVIFGRVLQVIDRPRDSYMLAEKCGFGTIPVNPLKTSLRVLSCDWMLSRWT